MLGSRGTHEDTLAVGSETPEVVLLVVLNNPDVVLIIGVVL